MNALELLKQYKESSREINNELRNGKMTFENIAIDALFSDREIPPTLYRLIDNKYARFEGDVFCDFAYLSCTDDIDNFILKTDPTNHLACLKINVNSPFPCIHVEELLPEFASEGEYILPRNINMQLVGIETYDSIEGFDLFLENLNSVTGSNELWECGIRTISQYDLEIV